MKRIVQIENIILIPGLIAVVFFALPTMIPETTLHEYSQGFSNSGRQFHSFWNYSFVLTYKAAFVIGLFLSCRRVFNKYSQSKASYKWALSSISLSASVLTMVLIFLTVNFDPAFITGKQLPGDLGISILGHIEIPLPSDGPVIWVIESIGSLVMISLVAVSLYFLWRIYRIEPSWQPANKVFIGKNRPENSNIFLSQYFTVSVLQFSGLLPFSAPLQDAILPLFVYLPMLANIFLFYPRFTRGSFLRKISLNVVVQFYMASVFAVPYLLLFNLSDLSLSMALATAIPSLFITLLIVSHVISIPYFLLRRQAISAHTKLVKKVERQDSELSLLKSQINPHFLFNSLNTVYGLALQEESPRTAEGVQKLSSMMRFMLLENTADKISLDREIGYIHDYIDFQRLRIANNDNISLDIDIKDNDCHNQIAPMLLIPMIENAFKHGISMKEPSWIKVMLSCNQQEISLQIENSLHNKSTSTLEESGIGLENVRKRLDILYPEKHIFKLTQTPETFSADIKVTLS
ncbi:MAG: histidine kinase [Roseivirga sp.]|nr:histidine kinase [Roseivirga sp.]